MELNPQRLWLFALFLRRRLVVLQAGAAKVYAIEASGMAKYARQLVAASGAPHLPCCFLLSLPLAANHSTNQPISQSIGRCGGPVGASSSQRFLISEA